MPFIILGIVTLFVGIYFVRFGVKNENKEILIGAIALVVAALVLIIVFGFFYRSTTLFEV